MSEEKRQFVGTLKEVAERFGVSLGEVRRWRGDFKCPCLEKRPYDTEAVKLWLQHQAALLIDPAKAESLEKVREEVKKLQDERKFTTRDKILFVAAATLGLKLTQDVLTWLNGEERTHLTVLPPREIVFSSEVEYEAWAKRVEHELSTIGFKTTRFGKQPRRGLAVPKNSPFREIRISIASGKAVFEIVDLSGNVVLKKTEDELMISIGPPEIVLGPPLDYREEHEP